MNDVAPFPYVPLENPEAKAPAGTNFYRSPMRVAILSALTAGIYELWWFWQLFTAARRERFPRTRPFGWIFVPGYWWYVVYQQFSDFSNEAARLTGRRAFNPAIAVWLLVISDITGRVASRVNETGVASVAFLVSSVTIVPCFYMVQKGANAYFAARYPDARPRGMTWGEWLAAVLGGILFAVSMLGIVAWLSGAR